VQKIKFVFELRRVEELGHGQFWPAARTAQGTRQPFGGGQAGHRTADAIGYPFEIAVGDGKVRAHLGDQQTVEIIATPVGQRSHRQRQHDAKRNQRQQQEPGADGAPDRRGLRGGQMPQA
jgi:hypothetical protein